MTSTPTVTPINFRPATQADCADLVLRGYGDNHTPSDIANGLVGHDCCSLVLLLIATAFPQRLPEWTDRGGLQHVEEFCCYEHGGTDVVIGRAADSVMDLYDLVKGAVVTIEDRVERLACPHPPDG